MSQEKTMLTRKYVLIPERSDSPLWEKRVYNFTVRDYEDRIRFYQDQYKNSKKKEMREKASGRLEALNAELDAFLENPEITNKIVNNYTFGLVRTAMKEESARKNYIVEYVRMILTAERAYAMDFRDRNKRINEILKYAYRKKGSNKGSLFDETEIGNILGSYGIGFSQMLTRKIQDCCNKGALEGRASFPFFKEDSPFTVQKAAMGFSHDYDSYEELCEHARNCKLYFDYGGNGKPHIARFCIDVGHGKKRDDLMETLLKVYSGEYEYCGSSIQISKNKIILNLSMKIPKETVENLDESTVVGVALGLVQPAVCALNNDSYVRLVIGDKRDLLDKRIMIQERKRRIQKSTPDACGGHGYKRKTKALDQISHIEKNFTETYCHKVSRNIVNYALENHAKYINMENMAGVDMTPFILRNSFASRIRMYTAYKAEQYGIEVRLVNPAFNAQVCSVCGGWAPEQKSPKIEFTCVDPECKSHSTYERGFTTDFNHARNIAMSTLFMEKGTCSKASIMDAAEYYGIEDKYQESLEKEKEVE